MTYNLYCWVSILLLISTFAAGEDNLSERRYEAIRQMKVKMRQYYECLTYREKRFLHLESFPAEAVVALKHGRANLPCFHCIDPRKSQEVLERKVVWAHQRLDTSEELKLLQVVEYNQDKESKKKADKTYEVGEERNLIIQPFDKEVEGKITQGPMVHSGFYSCWDNITAKLLSLYYVDILPEIPHKLVWKGIKGLEEVANTELQSEGLRVFSDYSFWTECNRCGFGVGEEKLFGPCTVIALDWEKFNQSKPSGLSSGSWSSLVGLFKLFPFGLPCRSSLLPSEVRSHSAIKDRSDEMKIRPCKRKCRDEESEPRVITRTNAQGQEEVVEVVEPGYYTFDDPPPVSTPPVRRFSVTNLRVNQSVLIDCPHEVPGGKFWRYLNRSNEQSIRLSSMQAQETFHGRVSIDHLERLLIRNVRKTDEGVYSCILWDHTLLLTGKIHISVDTMVRVVQAYVVALFAGLLITSIFFLMAYQTSKVKWGARESREQRVRDKEQERVDAEVATKARVKEEKVRGIYKEKKDDAKNRSEDGEKKGEKEVGAEKQEPEIRKKEQEPGKKEIDF